MFGYLDYYDQLNSMLHQNVQTWQAIVVKTDGSTPAKIGMHLAVSLDETIIGNLGGGNLEYYVINYILSEHPQINTTLKFSLGNMGEPLQLTEKQNEKALSIEMICGGYVEILVEPLFSPHNLYIIGGGHCGKALAQIAAITGFNITVIDNRKEQLNPIDFPSGCTLSLNDYSEIGHDIVFTEKCFIVIMTHGHVHDKEVLQQCLKQPFRYLGMIGSRLKVKNTFDRLLSEGYNHQDLARVDAPIGISIGSQTPHEIAVSITAQLIKVRNLGGI